MSLSPAPASPPSSPWADGQIVSGQGVVYKYDLANNRLKVYQNSIVNVSGIATVNGTALVEASVTPDKATFAATFGVNTPPGSPAIGSMYIVGSSPTGAWSGLANHLEICTATTPSVTWQDVTPYEGLLVWDQVANALMGWNGTVWTAATPITSSAIPSNTITTAMLQDNSITVQKANFKVVSKSTSSAPGGASIGDAYIVAATPGGGDAWFGQTGNLAIKTGATNTAADWTFYAPASGHLYWVNDVGMLYGYNGSAYVDIGPMTIAASSSSGLTLSGANALAISPTDIAALVGGLSVGDSGLITLARKLSSEMTTDSTSSTTLSGTLSGTVNKTTVLADFYFTFTHTSGTTYTYPTATTNNRLQRIDGLADATGSSLVQFTATVTSGSFSGVTAGTVTSGTFVVSFIPALPTANYVVQAYDTGGGPVNSGSMAISSRSVDGFTATMTNALTFTTAIGFRLYV